MLTVCYAGGVEDYDVVTVEQAARELGVSHAAVLKRIRQGQIKAMLVSPRLYLITRAELRRAHAGKMRPGPKRRAPEKGSTA